MIRPALERLTAEGVPFATRGVQPIDDPPHGGDVDILVSSSDVARADRALHAAGFHHLESPGHRGHRFYLAFERERRRWLKIDVNLVPPGLGWNLSARDDDHLRRFAGYRIGTKANPSTVERLWSALARRRPLGRRRQGPVVAVLGPDGAGKGTVVSAVRTRVPATVTPVYLGHGDTSRLEYVGRRRVPGGARRSTGTLARTAARSLLALLPRDAREAQYGARQALLASLRVWLAYVYAWRGDIVVCDRHPLEELAVEAPRGEPARRLELAILRRLVPWPDAIVLLDAPGEVLFHRKRDHSPELLERRRHAYRAVFGSRGATVVSTTGELEESVSQASAVLWDALRKRRGW